MIEMFLSMASGSSDSSRGLATWVLSLGLLLLTMLVFLLSSLVDEGRPRCGQNIHRTGVP